MQMSNLALKMKMILTLPLKKFQMSKINKIKIQECPITTGNISLKDLVSKNWDLGCIIQDPKMQKK